MKIRHAKEAILFVGAMSLMANQAFAVTAAPVTTGSTSQIVAQTKVSQAVSSATGAATAAPASSSSASVLSSLNSLTSSNTAANIAAVNAINTMNQKAGAKTPAAVVTAGSSSSGGSSSSSASASNASNYRGMSFSEQVDPRTGEVEMSYPGISVPGIGGMDFNLGIVYDELDYNANQPLGSFGIGPGWSFNITTYDPTTHIMTFGDGSQYYLQGNQLLYYTLKDLNISTAGGKIQDTHLDKSRSYQYELDYYNGTKEYLDSNGNLIYKVDRFGNSISYSYIAGQAGGNYLSKVIDTYNNVYSFKYNDSGSNSSVVISLPDGYQIKYMYNGQEQLFTAIDQAGDVTQVQYQTYQTTTGKEDYLVPAWIEDATGLKSSFQYITLGMGDPKSPGGVPAVNQVNQIDYSNPQWKIDPTYYSYGAPPEDASSTNNYTGYPQIWNDTVPEYVDQVMNSDQNNPFGNGTSNAYYYYTVVNQGPKEIVSKYDYLHLLAETDVYDTSSGVPKIWSKSLFTYEGESSQGVLPVWPAYGSSSTNGKPVPANYQRPIKTVLKYFQNGVKRIITTTEDYNNQGLVTHEVYPNGTVENYTYGAYGQALTDTTTIFDNNGNPSEAFQTVNTLSSDGKEITNTQMEVSHNPGAKTPTFADITDEAFQYDQYGRVLQDITTAGPNAASEGLFTTETIGTSSFAVPGSQVNYTYNENTPSTGQETDVVTTTRIDPKTQQSTTINVSQIVSTTDGTVLSKTDGNGNTTTYKYDGIGRVIQETAPNNTVEKDFYYTYNDSISNPSLRNAEDALEANGYETEQQFNGMSEETAELDNSNAAHTTASGAPTRLLAEKVYDGLNQLQKEIDVPDNLTEVHKYDVLGREINTIDPTGVQNLTVYNDAYNTTESEKSAYSESADGSLISSSESQISDPDNNVIEDDQYPSNNQGLAGVEYQATGSGIVSTYNYTGLDEEMKNNFVDNNPVAATISYAKTTYYDDLRKVNQKVLTDSNNNTVTKTGNYDYMGEPLSETQTQQIVNQGPVQSPSGTATGHSYAYDSMGEIMYDTDVTGRVLQTTYDNDGNTLTHTDYQGGQDVSVYNNMNEMIESYYQPSSGGKEFDTHYDYDPVTGEMLDQYFTSNQAGSEIKYVYTPDDYLQNIVYPDGTTLSYTYDASGRVATFTDAAGSLSTYTYYPTGTTNQAGLLQSVSIKTKDGVTASVNYSYDGLGRLSAISRSNGVVTSIAYDKFDREQSLTTKNANGNLISNETYTYDDLNNVVQEVVSSQEDTSSYGNYKIVYTYDVDNRLLNSTTYSEAAANAGAVIDVENYGYDANGNVVALQSSIKGNVNYTYNSLDQLTNMTWNSKPGIDDSLSFTYDANGNMQNIPVDVGGVFGDAIASYDAINEMTGLHYGGSRTLNGDFTYTYYPNGLRETKSDGTTTITFYYDADGNLVDEKDNSNDMTSYLMGESREARILEMNGQASQVSFYTKDLHGSVIANTDASGNLPGSSS